MLEYLRNAADKPVAKVLMFVLIFSFVGWGAAEWIFGGVSSDTTLIHVGDADVSLQQFNTERSRVLSEMTKDEQRATYTDPVKSAALTQNVMSTLTMNQLLTNRANDLGLVVSDQKIIDEIKSNPQFQVNGEFVPWMYTMVLQSSGVNEEDIIATVRGNTLRQMVAGVASSPLTVPKFAVDAMYNARYATRNIEYTTVKFEDFKVGTPNEEQLKSYYAQHPQVVPETRSLSYVFVAADMSKPDIYDEGFKNMQQIEDMIISGDSLSDAATKYKAEFVQIKDITRDAKLTDKILSDDLIAKAFSMDPETESEIVELKEGFVILRVDSVNAAHNAEFADVKEGLISDWAKSEQRKQAYVRANEDLVALNGGKKIKNAKSAMVSRTDGAPLAVLSDTFAHRDGENVIVEDKNAFYVLHIEKTILPKADAGKKETLRKELEKTSQSYASDDYSQFLKRHYPVSVNDKVFRRFVAK